MQYAGVLPKLKWMFLGKFQLRVRESEVVGCTRFVATARAEEKLGISLRMQMLGRERITEPDEPVEGI